MTPEVWTALWFHEHGAPVAQTICLWAWMLSGVVLPIAAVCSVRYLWRIARAQERMQNVTEDWWSPPIGPKKRSE